MRTRIVAALLLGLLATRGICPSAFAQEGPQSLPSVDVHIDKATLHTEIASTPQEQEIGLMYRPKMADNNGMIFLLPLGTATFWMKNTLIPLSVAFIDKNGVILEIHDMKAMDTSITRSDSNQVAYALEANLHWFSLNGIKPGDKLDPPPATLQTKARLDSIKDTISRWDSTKN